jgi:hypothetical protein
MSEFRSTDRSRTSLWQLVAIVAVAACLGLAILEARAAVAFVVPGLVAIGGLGLLCYACRAPEHRTASRHVVIWASASLAAHLVIGAVITQSRISIEFFGGDARYYDTLANALAQHWNHAGLAPPLPAGKEGFIYVLGALYLVFGHFKVAGLIMNAALSAALVPLAFDTTRRLFGMEAARRVVPLVVLLPGFLIWTSQLLREAGILFFIALAANAAVRLTARFSVVPLLALAAAIAGLLSFRGNVGYIVAIAVFAGIVVGRRGIVSGIGTGATALALLAVLVFVVGVGYAGYRLSSDANLKQVNTARTELSTTAGSGFAPATDVSTPARALDYLPKGTIQFLLGPFPWQVNSSRQVLGFLEVLVLWALIPSFVRGLRSGWRIAGRRTAVLLLPALLLTVMLALLIGNFGTVTRERIQVVILLLPFVALGLAERPAFARFRRARYAHAPTRAPVLSAARSRATRLS